MPILHKNGNLEYREGEKRIPLTMYRPTDDPNVFEPKFDSPCELRKFKGELCKRTNLPKFLWRCLEYSKAATIEVCASCTLPQEQRTKQSAIERGRIKQVNREQDKRVPEDTAGSGENNDPVEPGPADLLGAEPEHGDQL